MKSRRVKDLINTEDFDRNKYKTVQYLLHLQFLFKQLFIGRWSTINHFPTDYDTIQCSCANLHLLRQISMLIPTNTNLEKPV
jgi:hypothetical protein